MTVMRNHDSAGQLVIDTVSEHFGEPAPMDTREHNTRQGDAVLCYKLDMNTGSDIMLVTTPCNDNKRRYTAGHLPVLMQSKVSPAVSLVATTSAGYTLRDNTQHGDTVGRQNHDTAMLIPATDHSSGAQH